MILQSDVHIFSNTDISFAVTFTFQYIHIIYHSCLASLRYATAGTDFCNQIKDLDKIGTDADEIKTKLEAAGATVELK